MRRDAQKAREGQLSNLADGGGECDLVIWFEDSIEIIEIEGSAVKAVHRDGTSIRGIHAVSYRRAQHTNRMLNRLQIHCSQAIARMVGNFGGKGIFLTRNTGMNAVSQTSTPEQVPCILNGRGCMLGRN